MGLLDTSCAAELAANYEGGLGAYYTAILDNKGVCGSNLLVANLGIGVPTGWWGYVNGKKRRAARAPMFDWFRGTAQSQGWSKTTVIAVILLLWLVIGGGSEDDPAATTTKTSLFGSLFKGFTNMMSAPKKNLEKTEVTGAAVGMGVSCYIGGLYMGYNQ
jgi:hypothetical protein